MCGRCRHVFNAFEALKRIEDADVGEPIDYSVVDSTQSREVSDAASAETAPAEAVVVADVFDLSAPPEGPPSNEVVTNSSSEIDAVDSYDSYDSYDEALKKLELAEQSAAADETAAYAFALPAEEVNAELQAPSGVAPEPNVESVPTDAPRQADDLMPSAKEPELRAAPITAVIDNPLISGPLPRQTAPSRAWTWLAVFAGAALLVQAIYYFRSQIVQQYPQLRPSLAAACEPIGCTVSWGRDQALIKIESSELIEPPGRPGKILLTATLVNRATMKQDFPAIDVKLTDANNAVLASRVLLPAEYLGRTPSAGEGLTPNAELYINLNLELVGKSPASGYGLRAFYP